MGRKNAIRSLVTSISLVSYHKIVYEKGEKQEAKKHLSDEIRNYSTEGFEKAQEYGFTKDELKRIESKSIKHTLSVLKIKYPDVQCSDADAKEKVRDTMQEFLLL